MGLRRLYDLPVFTTTGTLSLTSGLDNQPPMFLDVYDRIFGIRLPNNS
ncbi:hypothetical protein D322_3070 [Yersinia enterocolitica IP 10393]|nr:hypothetical protein D322_3070 [Yersinia enterocolitica IP 10393]